MEYTEAAYKPNARKPTFCPAGVDSDNRWQGQTAYDSIPVVHWPITTKRQNCF